ncbi:MAG TPA: MlaD family protein [Vicinamibacterales bacterium]|nr:MlaD family protein [Vicinamibacterales bacterium]
MARTHSLAWSQLKIGILGVVALGLASMLIIAVGGQGGFAWQRYALKTKFTDIQGLKTGAVVRVAGVDVGKVTAIEFAGAEVEVTLEVNEAQQERITEHSRASIGALSLLGEPIIIISPSAAGRRLQHGDYIQSEGAAPGIGTMAGPVQEAVGEVTQLLQDVRAGKGTVGKLFTDEALYQEFNALLGAAEGVVAGINRGQGTLGKLARDDSAYRQLTASLADLNAMTRRIRAGEGSLGRLLNDDALAKSLSSTASSVDEIAAKINRGEGTAGKLLNEKELYDRFNAISERIDKLVAAVEGGQGTAGSLLKDKQLYDNMNGAANELRSLIADIRKDPRKYLNVRVSIF